VSALDAEGPRRLLAQPEIQRVLSALAVPGEETRLVGGCVRDALLGGASSDIDLATTLLPDATMARAAAAGLKAIPTGFDHGTVTVVASGRPFEVTTLREDIDTDGRHAVVRFGRDFARDAERRDFTINALSLRADGAVADTTNGLDDLAAGRVRFIGEAATRIAEDSLRILRFFRFHARFGRGAPDETGLRACIAAQGAIEGLSRERVRAELLKLLLAPGAVEAIALMERAGILARLLRGPADVGRLGRLVAARPGADEVARLAALALRAESDIDRLLDALRLSKTEAAALSASTAARASLSALATIGLGAMRGLIACHDARPIADALAAAEAGERPGIAPDALALLDAVEAGLAPRPVFPLTGADLVARGVPPGPMVGQGLAAARARWLAEGCPEDTAAIEELLAHGLSAAGQGTDRTR
jgi:tRNA nucleotidyltransferase/poly(A) polymerase